MNLLVSKRACIVCKEVKPISEFHIDRNQGDGRKKDCKTCRKLAQASKYKEKMGSLNTVQLEENRALGRERNRKLRKNNPDCLRQAQQRYMKKLRSDPEKLEDIRAKNRERARKQRADLMKRRQEVADKYARGEW